MIVRLIVFIIILTLLWYLVKRVRSLLNQRAEQVNENQKKSPNTEQMVVCKQCGVYTPINHAIKANEQDFYCSTEHYEQSTSK